MYNFLLKLQRIRECTRIHRTKWGQLRTLTHVNLSIISIPKSLAGSPYMAHKYAPIPISCLLYTEWMQDLSANIYTPRACVLIVQDSAGMHHGE